MADNLKTIKAQLVAAYNHKADERDAAAKEDWKVRERDAFLNRMRTARTILEIGCGPGHDALFFKENGFDVTCIDLSPNMIALCRNKGLNAYVMDFSQLDFPNASFDAVWALNCLLHVPKAELPNVVSGIQRVLKPGGLFYMGVYGRHDSEGVWEGDSYEPKRFFSFFAEETLRKTLAPFFKNVAFKVLPHSDALDFQSVVVVKES